MENAGVDISTRYTDMARVDIAGMDNAAPLWQGWTMQEETRMVQLPATAAIEYVAAFVTRTRTKTKIVRGVSFVRGAYARSPKVQ